MKRIPIRRTGNRSNLFMGGDRELVMFSGVISFALIFASQEWKAFVYGVLLWFFSLYIFRQMAKSDPKMRFVYFRHRKYKKYYSPRSTPFKENLRPYN